jgi:hypothetical protein
MRVDGGASRRRSSVIVWYARAWTGETGMGAVLDGRMASCGGAAARREGERGI